MYCGGKQSTQEPSLVQRRSHPLLSLSFDVRHDPRPVTCEHKQVSKKAALLDAAVVVGDTVTLVNAQISTPSKSLPREGVWPVPSTGFRGTNVGGGTLGCATLIYPASVSGIVSGCHCCLCKDRADVDENAQWAVLFAARPCSHHYINKRSRCHPGVSVASPAGQC